MRFFTKEWYERQKKDADIRNSVARFYQQGIESTEHLKMHRALHEHDSRVVDFRFEGTIAVLSLDPRGSDSYDKEIRFLNARILENESVTTGDWWLYHEVYPTDDGWEIHILFTAGDEDFKYLTLLASAAEFVEDEQKKQYQETLQKLMSDFHNAEGEEKQKIEAEMDRLIEEYRK